MKYSPLFILFLFTDKFFSQNLIQNGGFESHKQYSKIDTHSNLSVNKLIKWNCFGYETLGNFDYSIMGHYQRLWPEFKDIKPHSGNSCAKFDYLEYCQSPLGRGCASYLINEFIKPMEVGKYYEISYWIYLPSNDSRYTEAIKHIGFHLSLDEINYPSYNIIPLNFFPHNKSEFNKWVEVKTRIQALCPLRYIVYGIFKTKTFPLSIQPDNVIPFCYLIDDVSIKEIELNSDKSVIPYCKDSSTINYLKNVVTENKDSLYFKNDDANLSKEMIVQLRLFIQKIPSYSLIYIKGYASSNGSLIYNLKLANRRAKEIEDFLINSLGISEERVISYSIDSLEWEKKIFKQTNIDWKMVELTSPPFDSIMTFYNIGLKFLKENKLALSDKYFTKWINKVDIEKILYLLFDPRISKLNNTTLIPVLSTKIINRYNKFYNSKNRFFIDSLGIANHYFRSIDMDLNFGLGYVKYYDQKILNELMVHDSIILKYDKAHIKLAMLFLEKNKFPTITEYGKRAVYNFINIIIHSMDTTLYKNYLPLIYNNCMKGENEWLSYVTLFDRDLILKNQKQMYGTQYTSKNGKDELYPVDSIILVNERRRKLGLHPINYN